MIKLLFWLIGDLLLRCKIIRTDSEVKLSRDIKWFALAWDMMALCSKYVTQQNPPGATAIDWALTYRTDRGLSWGLISD